MRSPNRGYELRPLEGESYEIWERGDRLVQLGEQMESTADTLSTIGDSSIHRSKGTDELAEMASETSADLAAAATRYELTGRTLRTYAAALGTAQTWIHPRIDDIEAAELAYVSAREAQADAASRLDSLDTVLPWEDEPTDQQRTSASADASHATTAMLLAKDTRDGLWEEFETRFSTWSDAYDDAVDGIQNAMDTAGNDDGRWEFLDNVLDVLAIVILVLTVIALIIGAPLTGLLAGIILALSALVLALTLLKAAYGRATLSDVAWAVVGILPFALAGRIAKGIPSLSNAISTSRTAITQSIRSGLPAFRFLRAGTWSTPFRWLAAPSAARAAAPRPSIFTNPLRAMADGSPELQQVRRFVDGLRSSPHKGLDDIENLITTVDDFALGGGRRAINVAYFSTFFAIDGSGVAGVRPDIPFLDQVSLR